MSTTRSITRPVSPGRPASVAGRMPLAARLTLDHLQRLDQGVLHVELPDGSSRIHGRGERSASMQIHDWAVFERVLRHGDIGFAEAYIDGQWHTPDLTALLTLLAANRAALDAPLYGSWLGRMAHRIAHLLRANTRTGSKRNIAAHYDLGNDFYALWLDPGMTYSSALFNDGADSLEEAQEAKYRRIIGALELAPGSRLLEIGCGWGGLAERCAAAGHHVTGVSLSRRQLDYATARLSHAGLTDHAQFEFRDYRDIRGQYDAVASIEMIEAVGERWWPAYFRKLASVLPQGGRAVVQSILIDDTLFERYRRGSDFIQQYVFPGGMLPSRTSFRASAAQAGLKVEAEFAFGSDYAKTLCIWRDSFNQKLQEVRQLGFDEAFIRLWNFYLMYCSAGFSERNIDVVQFTLSHDAPTHSADALSA